MSIRHRLLNIGTGFLVLFLAWKLIQVFLSPFIAEGLLTVAVLGVAAVVLNNAGEKIIDFVKGNLAFTPRIPRLKPAASPVEKDFEEYEENIPEIY